jgi:hypothetical protein
VVELDVDPQFSSLEQFVEVPYRLVPIAAPGEAPGEAELGSAVPSEGFLEPLRCSFLEASRPLEPGEKSFLISVSHLVDGQPSFSRRAYTAKDSATLAEVDAIVRKEKGIDEQPLAWFVTDVTTGIDQYQPDTVVIGEIGVSDKRPLTLRTPEPGEVPSDTEPVSRLEEAGVMISVMRPVAKPPKVYNFVVPQRHNEEFQLELPAGATVLIARQAVARQCGVQYDDIGLVFLGKIMKDEFILERMRIGDKVITVSVNDKRTVILKTRLTVIKR